MKGFAGAIVLFSMLILAIILISSTYQIKNDDNSSIFIPKIKNFIAINEFNLKNMSYDCNWQKEEQELKDCLQAGSNVIFDKVGFDLMVSCIKTPLEKIDTNTYQMDMNCTNKVILDKSTIFNIKKRITLTSPIQ